MAIQPRSLGRALSRTHAGPNAPVRLGVLTNPVALHNHRFPFTHRNLVRRLGTAYAVETADRTKIEGAIRSLLLDREVNVLAINGGDGTIHAAMNTMARAFPADSPLPILLLLNGGTYNMASRALGTKGDPVRTVSRFLERYRGASLRDIKTREVGVVEVHPEGRESMIGMVFGSEVVANALDLCDRMGSGYLGLARLLLQGVAGYALRTDFYRRHADLLRPSHPWIEVDGRGVGDSIGVVASTIDLMLARGLICSLTVVPQMKGFHAKVVRGKSPGDVVRLLPHLLWEVPHPMIETVPDASRLRTFGRFTVDGELYEHEGVIEVRANPLRFRVVSGDDL